MQGKRDYIEFAIRVFCGAAVVSAALYSVITLVWACAVLWGVS